MKSINQFSFFKIFSFATLVLGLNSCQEDAVQILPERNFELVWSDEFQGNAGTSPDASKWNYNLGAGGWGNNELQNYTNSTNNVALDGQGNLVITAIKNGNTYTSARITTKNLFSHAYGKIEARIKTPYGKGIWPAFWMLGDNIDSVGWPNCGEIDIMELKGNQPNTIFGSLHGPGYFGGAAVSKSYTMKDARFDQDFHIFSVEWKENQIDFFVDGYLYHRVLAKNIPGEWAFNHPFFLILNVAVGGNFVGSPIDSTTFPQKMYVDYVRVYRQQ